MAIFIIEGKNRTEFCKPSAKDVDRKRFFATRGMLYRGYPDQFTRMRVFKYGKEISTEEVIVYQENCIHAQQERGIVITPDKMMADIDEYKHITRNKFPPQKSWGILSSKNLSSLKKSAPMILVGVVLLYAFISNGGHL